MKSAKARAADRARAAVRRKELRASGMCLSCCKRKRVNKTHCEPCRVRHLNGVRARYARTKAKKPSTRAKIKTTKPKEPTPMAAANDNSKDQPIDWSQPITHVKGQPAKFLGERDTHHLTGAPTGEYRYFVAIGDKYVQYYNVYGRLPSPVPGRNGAKMVTGSAVQPAQTAAASEGTSVDIAPLIQAIRDLQTTVRGSINKMRQDILAGQRQQTVHYIEAVGGDVPAELRPTQNGLGEEATS